MDTNKYWSLFLLCFLAIIWAKGIRAAHLYHDCGKLFNPVNYLDQLPSLSLPYQQSIPYINPPIRASPVVPTKVINVVTKYVYKNPVCVKISGTKSACKAAAAAVGNSKNTPQDGDDQIVTKEYTVNGRRHKSIQNPIPEFGMYLQGSEEPRPFGKAGTKTPTLSPEAVKEMLIEDRLDQLETILPHYTRRRVFQTSTITVTKVKSNNRATATLLVKNCVPQGYDVCPRKVKQRRSKVARNTNSSAEADHYFG